MKVPTRERRERAAKTANLNRGPKLHDGISGPLLSDLGIKAGELLKAMEKHPPGPSKKDRSHDAIEPPLLSDLGIEPDQSSRWQRIASVPEKLREAYKAEDRESGEVASPGSPTRFRRLR